jgi:hypothetical protein
VSRILPSVLALLVLAACGGTSASIDRADRPAQARRLGGSGEMADRCAADEARNEVSEYDTSGDEYPDVRKVFLRVGDPPAVHLVLVCREADLNADGTRDVVRYYTDEGRPLREEADRDFDGQMDEILFFEGGRIARMEHDTTGDGMVDTKIFYEDGSPIRAERDVAGRSTPQRWAPDRWEYYENGRMIRMGTDLDGDGRVDRWDRDEVYHDQRDAQRRADAASDQVAEDMGAIDDGDEDTSDDDEDI